MSSWSLFRRVCLAALLGALGCGDDDQPSTPAGGAEGMCGLECGEDEASSETESRPPVDPTSPADPSDPLAGLDELDDVAVQPVSPASAPPTDGCVPFAAAPQRLWSTPGPANVVAVEDDGFVFAGYARRDDAEDLWVVSARPQGLPRPLLREALEVPANFERRAAPGLGAFDGGHVGVAITDGAANARFVTLTLALASGGRRDPWKLLGTSVDQRFVPAVALRGGRYVVAWTEAAEASMHVRYVAFDPAGNELARRDLTQPGQGACAPTFEDGPDGALVFLDPHEAISLALGADLATDPPPVHPLRPVSHVTDPALLAAGRVGERTLLGYTAVGNEAMTAVGLVYTEPDRQVPAQAIVPSAGYGPLHVDAATASDRVVFVADRPRGRERESARELVVREAIAEAEGVRLGEAAVIRGPSEGPASLGRIARHRDGTYAVVFTAEDGVYASFLRCDE